MNNTPELRARCAQKIEQAAARIPSLSVFAGLDGFVDDIIHVVDKRENAEQFIRLQTLSALGQRISAAAGKSTNIELVPQKTKLGGNGPIYANALATFGTQVTYLGALGYPTLHPVFQTFAARADVHSIAEPGYTDALEFDDGKLMLGKSAHLRDVNWQNITERYGRKTFVDKFSSTSLVAFVNWTMLPAMSRIWESIQAEVCPSLQGPRRLLFFDLADPERRQPADIREALDLIARFQTHFDVILGLNEKESHEIAKVLGLPLPDGSPQALADLTRRIQAQVPIKTLVVHPVSYALATGDGESAMVQGPYVAKPLITTGAGDHFNAGFCLGQMLGLTREESLLAGVSTSGYYVRTAQSPTPAQLAGMMRDWPKSETAD